MLRLLPNAVLSSSASSGMAASAGLVAGLLSTALLLPFGQLARAQNMIDGMIKNYCLKAVNDEVKASGKPAPAGMPDYTCNCVVQEMKKKKSVEQAKVTCKAAAEKKYNL